MRHPFLSVLLALSFAPICVVAVCYLVRHTARSANPSYINEPLRRADAKPPSVKFIGYDTHIELESSISGRHIVIAEGWATSFFVGCIPLLVWLPAINRAIDRYGAQWLEEKKQIAYSTGRCPRCDYDLRATPERCPECGTSTRGAMKNTIRRIATDETNEPSAAKPQKRANISNRR